MSDQRHDRAGGARGGYWRNALALHGDEDVGAVFTCSLPALGACQPAVSGYRALGQVVRRLMVSIAATAAASACGSECR